MVLKILAVFVVATVALGHGHEGVAQAQSVLTIDETDELPAGWTQDESFKKLGAEVYHAPNSDVVLFLSDEPATDLSLAQWVEQYVDSKIVKKRKKKLKKKSKTSPIKSARSESVWLLTVAENSEKTKFISAFAVVKRDDGSLKVGEIAWNNNNKNNPAHTYLALQLLLNSSELSSTTPTQASRKVTSTSALDLVGDDIPKTKEPNPIVAAAGEGIDASEVHGLAYHWGKIKYRKDRNTGMRIPTYPKQATYLLLKNGWAYRNPDVPHSDLNEEASRRLQPKRWVEWKSNPQLIQGETLKPLPRGYTVDITVNRPSTSVGLRTTRTTFRGLKLTRDGRFETDRTTLSTSSFDVDPVLGSQNRTISSSGKGGTFSGSSIGTVVGGGTVMVSAARNNTNGGDHTGTYFVDGNTIELRYDNGAITRSSFGTNGLNSVILGRTNYWNKRK